MNDIPTSASEAMYPGGPISGGPGMDPRAQAIIDGGKARSFLTGGEPSPSPTPPPPKDTRPAAPTPQAFNAQTFGLPEGVDRAALSGDSHFQEFSALAKEQGFNNSQAEKMVALHHKALKASYDGFTQAVESWGKETQAALGHQVSDMTANIRDKVGNDADAQRFFELMNWSGLGNNVSVIRVLHRLARGY